jgi:hypothetical protein
MFYILQGFFIIKLTRCTNFPNLLRHETLHVSGSSSAHHQEFIHCTLGTGICYTGLKTAFEQNQDGTAVLFWSCSCTVSCRSKFGKFVHVVGFFIKKFVTMHGHTNVKYYKVFTDHRQHNYLLCSIRRVTRLRFSKPTWSSSGH